MSASASIIDGSFENQAVFQNLPSYQTGPSGELWGRSWNAGWSAEGLASSLRYLAPGASWSGSGQICRSEDFATGWKRARTGVVFGYIENDSSISQTFTVTETGTYDLSWFDANRSSWRGDTWFGRQNNYRVTVADALGNIQTLGNYTSEVFGGSEANSQANIGDARWDLENRQGWFSRNVSGFTLTAGVSYTLSFTSLSDDGRATLLDDISLTIVPAPGALALLGAAAAVGSRRRR